MALIVPFDGSKLSKAALARAVQFDAVLEEGVLVVSVIPRDNAKYARERGWLESTAAFDADAIVSHLRSEAMAIAPDAEFHSVFVGASAPHGTIASRIRRFAKNHGATIVFLGSENAGRIVGGITVGQSVATDRAYDTMLVSHEQSPKIGTLEAKVPAEDLV